MPEPISYYPAPSWDRQVGGEPGGRTGTGGEGSMASEGGVRGGGGAQNERPHFQPVSPSAETSAVSMFVGLGWC